jgi:GMP synthase-like glutamine amidotransferase
MASVTASQTETRRFLPGARVIVLQHEDYAPAGNFGDWADARGFEVETLRLSDPWEVPDLSDVVFVASLGSDGHVYDEDLPWLAREMAVLAAAHETETPVCGICFGSQSLAHSLGAAVRRAEQPQIGWRELELTAGVEIPGGPWLFWHEDHFEVPPAAELVARTPRAPALFRTEKDWGIQFHPEISAEILDAWIEIPGQHLDDEVKSHLRRNLAIESAAARERAWWLYDAFLAHLESGDRPGERLSRFGR